MTHPFDAWKEKARQADILQEAVARGAKLKRAGREWIGPCVACGGTDRFSINPQKRIFNCRGSEGGDVIGLVMHIDGVQFWQACEALTGEPPPNGQSKPLSEAELAQRNRRRIENERAQQARKAEEAAHENDTREAALAIWEASTAICGTLAEKYLVTRGLPVPERGWPQSLRFHENLIHDFSRKKYPALVARVDDLAGDLTAVWRTYLRADGRKADIDPNKMGKGPSAGGAVRLFGTSKSIAIAEGIETALAFWMLTSGSRPTWAALSTSGLIGFEAPLGVESVLIAPDGDRPIRKRGHEYEPAVPAGRKAAEALRARLLHEGVAVTIAAEPKAGQDYLDLYQQHQREVA